MKDQEELWLTATDVKNWLYCRRLPFFRYFGKNRFYRSAPMKYGTYLHEVQERAERRSEGKKYGLLVPGKEMKLYLKDETLHLSGIVDMVLYDEKGAVYPVDFKSIAGEPHLSHRGQLCCYMALLSVNGYTAGGAGFLYGTVNKKLIMVKMENHENEYLQHILASIRSSILHERLPEVKGGSDRCINCGYVRYCNDIF